MDSFYTTKISLLGMYPLYKGYMNALPPKPLALKLPLTNCIQMELSGWVLAGGALECAHVLRLLRYSESY